MATFVGANNGFVVTWYDQSGGARNLAQATAATQPQIVDAGTYIGDVNWNGTSSVMSTAASSGTPSAFTLFAAGFNGQTTQLRPGEAAAVSAQIEQFAQQTGAGAAVSGQAVVPEPGSIALLSVGALGLLSRRRRSR